jgi:biopolymer transport protein ExbD
MYYELKAQRARRRKVLINITPLIDVLFLLLIFFIVSSTFLEQPSITVELPQAQTAEAQKIEQYVILVGEDGSVYINNEQCLPAVFAETLARIYSEDKDAHIVLKADQNASYGVIIEVIDAVRQSGLKKIVALTKAASS